METSKLKKITLDSSYFTFITSCLITSLDPQMYFLGEKMIGNRSLSNMHVFNLFSLNNFLFLLEFTVIMT